MTEGMTSTGIDKRTIVRAQAERIAGPGPLLPLLHAVQEELGCIDDETVAHVAEALNLSRADGRVSLEPVYCLGLCATGPNAMIDGRPVSRLDAAKVDRIAAGVTA